VERPGSGRQEILGEAEFFCRAGRITARSMTNPDPLILLHGALGSSENFAQLLSALPSPARALAFDFPGHGADRSDAPFSIPAFAAAVERFMDERQLERADFFGYSMGGYVALYLAWKNPARVGRILTLGTKFAWSPETAAREAGRLDPEAIEAKVPAFAQSLARRHGPDRWKQVVRRTAALLTGLGAAPDLSDQAWPFITAPVVIGLGELDQMVGADESRAVVDALPNGRFEILPQTKHPIEQVEPRTLAEFIFVPSSEF
jgi:pimeloyl-ACP methyl ester carboxylesterase